MALGLIGKKIGMTRVFDKEAGSMVAVTVVDVAGNEFAQTRTVEKDGYVALQIAFDDQKAHRLTAAAKGHFEKHGSGPKKKLVEFRFEEGEELPSTEEDHPGASLFEDGQVVDVIGTTKGKGFQGVMKRYHFHGQPAAHGHMMHRRTGAVGAGSTPGRIWKNQKMPGRHGVYRRTTQNLKVVQSRPEDGVVLISGAVPGRKGSYVVIRPAIKARAAK
ncbi:MAG: 50S ribosomal protein L3 [Verrucomicrobiota bacterium]